MEGGVGFELGPERDDGAVDGEQDVDESLVAQDEARALQDAEDAAGRGGAVGAGRGAVRLREDALAHEREEDVAEGGVRGRGGVVSAVARGRLAREGEREGLELAALGVGVRGGLRRRGLAEEAKQRLEARHRALTRARGATPRGAAPRP